MTQVNIIEDLEKGIDLTELEEVRKENQNERARRENIKQNEEDRD